MTSCGQTFVNFLSPCPAGNPTPLRRRLHRKPLPSRVALKPGTFSPPSLSAFLTTSAPRAPSLLLSSPGCISLRYFVALLQTKMQPFQFHQCLHSPSCHLHFHNSSLCLLPTHILTAARGLPPPPLILKCHPESSSDLLGPNPHPLKLPVAPDPANHTPSKCSASLP